MSSRLGDLLRRHGTLVDGVAAAEPSPDADDEAVVRLLADEYRLPLVDPRTADVTAAALAAVPHALARRHDLVPVALHGAQLTVAMADPTDPPPSRSSSSPAASTCGSPSRRPSAVHEAIERLYGAHRSWRRPCPGSATRRPRSSRSPPRGCRRPRRRRSCASSTRSSPRRCGGAPATSTSSRTTTRCGSGSGSTASSTRSHRRRPGSPAAITTRVKVMAQLDIAERRLPQDGRLAWHWARRRGRPRVGAPDAASARSVVLRLLDRAGVERGSTTLGLDAAALAHLRRAAAQPHGLVLVTGPDRQRQDHHALRRARRAQRARRSTSAPSRTRSSIRLHGVNQVAGARRRRPDVRRRRCARFLRQDPDVIMVGEIRDLETADIAVKAALTGHLVLSTLHTNDAPSRRHPPARHGHSRRSWSPARCSLVLAQRLVRVVCARCARAVERRRRTSCALAGWSLARRSSPREHAAARLRRHRLSRPGRGVRGHGARRPRCARASSRARQRARAAAARARRPACGSLRAAALALAARGRHHAGRGPARHARDTAD